MSGRQAFLAAALAVPLLVSGCSSSGGEGGQTTCADWLAMEPEDASLTEPMTDEQTEVIQKMLRDHDKDDSEFGMNIVNAEAQITMFCGVDDTGTRANSDQPIEDGVNLD